MESINRFGRKMHLFYWLGYTFIVGNYNLSGNNRV